MKFGRLALAIVVLCALGATYYVVEVRQQAKKEELARKAAKLLAVESQEVRSIEVKGGRAGHLSLERRGTSWWITKPREAPASSTLAEGLVSALRLMTPGSTFDAQSEKLGEYGLSNPAFSVKVGLATGQKTLLFGESSAIGHLQYAKWEGEPKVFLLTGQLKDSFDKDLDSLREHLVFEFQPAAVEKIAVRGRSSPSWELIKEGEKSWRSSDPLLLIDPEKVSAFQFSLSTLRAETFLDETDMRSPACGLEPPEREIVLSVAGLKRPKRLWLGKPQEGSPPSGSLHAWAGPPFPVFLLSRQTVKELEKSALDFTDSHVALFEPGLAQRVSVENETLKKAFVKNERDWLEEGATGKPAKTFEVEEVLRLLRGLEFEKELAKADFEGRRGDELLIFRVGVREGGGSGKAGSWTVHRREGAAFVSDESAARYFEAPSKDLEDFESAVKALLSESS